MTQEDVAQAADVTVDFVVSAEAAVVTSKLGHLEAIGRVLGLRIDEMVSDPITVRPTEHVFASWPWSLSGFIQRHLMPIDGAYCVSEADVYRTVGAMRDSWEEHLKRSGEEVEQFLLADRLLDRERTRYIDRYVKIWKQNDETVLHATVDDRRVGVTVTLPVTEKAYNKLRRGEISFMDITGDDILPQSQFLVLDSGVEFPVGASVPAKKLSNAISFAIFYQIAVLAEDPMRDDFRMLTFAASPTNIQRLAAIGFVDHEVIMPIYGYQILEFMANNEDLKPEIRERSESIPFFAGMFRRWVIGDKALRRKRRMILRTLNIFRSLVKGRRDRSRRDVLAG
ncbi:hypothetical protein QTN89_13885 [Roseiconus lacunae]|uniref:XRE family transcriptional regulator n=2 Tax=Roseiconus lacunae TaxID=2605694 RepID=A0ABT7PJ57_9BACT|nr:hypothetical protein [Roseiconus lacunae]MDM4016530.1 hypothetical protein [Roseiconus lacunae]